MLGRRSLLDCLDLGPGPRRWPEHPVLHVRDMLAAYGSDGSDGDVEELRNLSVSEDRVLLHPEGLITEPEPYDHLDLVLIKLPQRIIIRGR